MISLQLNEPSATAVREELLEAILVDAEMDPLGRTWLHVRVDPRGGVWCQSALDHVPVQQSGRAVGVLYRWPAESTIASRNTNTLGVVVRIDPLDVTCGCTFDLNWEPTKGLVLSA